MGVSKFLGLNATRFVDEDEVGCDEDLYVQTYLESTNSGGSSDSLGRRALSEKTDMIDFYGQAIIAREASTNEDELRLEDFEGSLQDLTQDIPPRQISPPKP